MRDRHVTSFTRGEYSRHNPLVAKEATQKRTSDPLQRVSSQRAKAQSLRYGTLSYGNSIGKTSPKNVIVGTSTLLRDRTSLVLPNTPLPSTQLKPRTLWPCNSMQNRPHPHLHRRVPTTTPARVTTKHNIANQITHPMRLHKIQSTQKHTQE